jgi:hypothetical protein
MYSVTAKRSEYDSATSDDVALVLSKLSFILVKRIKYVTRKTYQGFCLNLFLFDGVQVVQNEIQSFYNFDFERFVRLSCKYSLSHVIHSLLDSL